MGEPDVTNDRVGDRVTISEAATLLGVHPNTVRNRVKAGIYEAEKVVTERGPTLMIDRDSLLDNTPTNITQQVVGRVEGRDLERLLTELVKAVEKDPERENRLEAVKLRVRALQTQVAVSSGLIVAFGVILSLIPDALYIDLLYAAFGSLLASVVFSFFYMHRLASHIAVNIERPRNRLAVVAEHVYHDLSMYSIAVGVAMFLLFLNANVP